VARVGGDEFALILPGADERQAVAVLGKVVAANAVPVLFENDTIASSVSIGACSYPSGARDGEELRNRADRAMYQAKNSGGNRFAFHQPSA
jgi:diguanylate cyclase (GGDEF)-like protein